MRKETVPVAVPLKGVLFDLLMAVMDSLEVWSAAAHDRRRGLAWRDAVTARMVAATSYVPYEDLVVEMAAEIGLSSRAAAELFDRWAHMEPWPDAAALSRLSLPYGFVTNCSTKLSSIAMRRSRSRPRFVLSAEEVGRYKPHPTIYQEACRRLGTPPERTLFVAGASYDCDGARGAGLRAWLVVRRPDQRLPDAHIPVAASLDEILVAIGSDTRASDC